MPTITESAELPAPPERVWKTITDPSTYAGWQTNHQGFNGEAPATLEAGTTFKQQLTMMGMPGEIAWTVADAAPPARLELAGQGPMGTTARMVYSLEAMDGGTSATCEASFEGAVLEQMAGALEQSSSKVMSESFEKLKALVS